MEDKKWVVYDNVAHKRSGGSSSEPSQKNSKEGLHPKKIMLSVWWNYKDIKVLYYELLPSGRTIDSNVYCSQLSKLNEAMRSKRPELANRKGVVFHRDKARPHTLLITQNKLLNLGWDVLPYPPYSPNLIL